MATSLVPRVNSPCPHTNAAVRSGDKEWFCASCQLPVYNFSLLNESEKSSLLSRPGRVCVAYRVSEEVTVVSASTWLFVHRLLRPWRVLVALATLLWPFAAPFLPMPRRLCEGSTATIANR